MEQRQLGVRVIQPQIARPGVRLIGSDAARPRLAVDAGHLELLELAELRAIHDQATKGRGRVERVFAARPRHQLEEGARRVTHDRPPKNLGNREGGDQQKPSAI
jgi:hypothetical protein